MFRSPAADGPARDKSAVGNFAASRRAPAQGSELSDLPIAQATKAGSRGDGARGSGRHRSDRP
jgi:hypothetical protein